MANKLGDAVVKANAMGKLKLGYSVDYNDILASLDKAKRIQDEMLRQINNPSSSTTSGDYQSFGGESGIITTETEYSTRLLQAGQLGGAVDGKGFVHGKYQAICTFKDFMGFTVDVTTDEGKKTLYVNRKNFNDGKSAGHGCISGNPVFPACRKENSKYFTTGLSGENNPFKIGIGIDVKNFGVDFFNVFFKKGGEEKFIDSEKLGKIAAMEALVAEVWIPQNISTVKLVKDKQGKKRKLVTKSKNKIADSQESQNVVNSINSTAENQNSSQQTQNKIKYENNYNAFVLHIKVIVDIQGSAKYVHVYLPTPVLLLNDYAQFQHNVSINTFFVSTSKLKSKNIKIVDGKEVSFSFADKKFNHKTCSIAGFTPKFLDGIKEESYAEHHITTLCSENKEGRVRLYFDKDKKDEVLKILGMSEEELKKKGWDKELFQGHYPESDVVQETTIISEQHGYINTDGDNDTCNFVNDVDWEKIKTISRFKNYYDYKDIIIKECSAENLNVRLMLAHMHAESAEDGIALSSLAWTKRFNPSGMLGDYTRVQGVPCKTSKDKNVGSDGEDHGNFLIFETAEYGIRAHCRWVNRSSYYGVKTKGLKTVKQYAIAMEQGVPAGGSSNSFCGKPTCRCKNYANNILTFYSEIPHLPNS